jgi:hypothetical protein
MYPFLPEARNKVGRTISGKDDNAGMRMSRFDVGDDALDLGGGKAGVCCDHQMKSCVRRILNVITEESIGLHNCYKVTLSPKYLFKTGSKYRLFGYDQDVVNRSPSNRLNIDTRFGHRLRRPTDGLSTCDYIIPSAN